MPGNPKASAALGATVAAAIGSALYVYVRRRSQRLPTRRAQLVCRCGNVAVDIHQPPSNYCLMETPCLQCACTDCVSFVEACVGDKRSREYCTPGVHNAIFYDSELLVAKGASSIRNMKLTKHSENRRIYTSCCGTPLGISIDYTGVNLILSNLVRPVARLESNEEALPKLAPTVCFFSKEANPKYSIEPASIQLIPKRGAPRFILYCLTRMVVLLLVGSYGPGEGFPRTPLTIGLKSIPSTKS